MNFYTLNKKIIANNYSEIIDYIDNEGGPNCRWEFRCAAQVAVDSTRMGREGHSVRALMDRGFSFMRIEGSGLRGNVPICALTELLFFAKEAKSRKPEAVNLLREVFEYEMLRNEFVPDEIIPITHTDMQNARRRVEYELKRSKEFLITPLK